jgi:hypothetical protein
MIRLITGPRALVNSVSSSDLCGSIDLLVQCTVDSEQVSSAPRTFLIDPILDAICLSHIKFDHSRNLEYLMDGIYRKFLVARLGDVDRASPSYFNGCELHTLFLSQVLRGIENVVRMYPGCSSLAKFGARCPRP